MSHTTGRSARHAAPAGPNAWTGLNSAGVTEKGGSLIADALAEIPQKFPLDRLPQGKYINPIVLLITMAPIDYSKTKAKALPSASFNSYKPAYETGRGETCRAFPGINYDCISDEEGAWDKNTNQVGAYWNYRPAIGSDPKLDLGHNMGLCSATTVAEATEAIPRCDGEGNLVCSAAHDNQRYDLMVLDIVGHRETVDMATRRQKPCVCEKTECSFKEPVCEPPPLIVSGMGRTVDSRGSSD